MEELAAMAGGECGGEAIDASVLTPDCIEHVMSYLDW